MSKATEKFVRDVMDKKPNKEIRESLKNILKEKVIQRLKDVKED